MHQIIREDWGYWVSENDVKLAAVVNRDFKPETIQFLTPDNFGLQLALMNRPRGHVIPSHVHLPVNRDLVGTQEVLIIRQGQLRADIYGLSRNYLCSVILQPGDIILLNQGGHGFSASEDCFFIEVKQGPYSAGKDKELFEVYVNERNFIERDENDSSKHS